VLAAAGFVLAYGRYDVGAYLWIELAFVVVAALASLVLFSRSARPLLARLVPVLRRVWLERPVRAVYEEMHAYRSDRLVLAKAFAATLGLQAVRVLTIWLAAKAVGVDLSPRPFFVMGPLLFLVMLVPFTINGFALRETFFVSFLGNLGVGADQAFATGFLFFLLSTALALPGAAILVWQSFRRGSAVGAPPAAPAEVLVRLHVEPHGEERELRPGDEQQRDEDHGRGRDAVAHRP
jgi:glycosyltransferase 2 family protein